MAIYFRELCLVAPSQVSRHATVRTATGMDRSWAWYRLRDRGFAQQTSPTTAGAPSEEDSLLRATKPKKVVLMCVVTFLWHLCWDSRVCTKPPKRRPPNLGTWPSKPKISYWTQMHDYALLRLEDVAIETAAVSNLILLIPKLYFEAQTPVFTPFLYRSTDQHMFLMF